MLSPSLIRSLPVPWCGSAPLGLVAIIGENVNRSIIYNLEDCLNEVYPLPYFFDILQYNEITNENLINHIDNEGKILYTKK